MTDLVIIGAGPAGMAAAISAKKSGIDDIIILERSHEAGGILNQCIHGGFGLHRFGEELTGTEYAHRFEREIKKLGIPIKSATMVTDISKGKIVTATNPDEGIFKIEAKSIILAMGCRERSKGALSIPGQRPSGIFSAGTAQRYININGYMPGREVVILGSGDIGLIMARRMTLEGAKVKMVCEIMPYSGGLARNIEQCLNDFDIPLKLSYTVVETHGKDRLTGVTIAKVDENLAPIKGTEEYVPCDTLLLSVGLIPENELSLGAGIKLSPVTKGPEVDQERETSVPGIFSCGNVLHVHDLVDFVSDEAEIAGKAASEFIKGRCEKKEDIKICTDGKIRYTVPQRITEKKDVCVYFRVSDVYRNVIINIYSQNGLILSKKKQKVTPGEMESVLIKKEQLSDANEIIFRLEDEPDGK